MRLLALGWPSPPPGRMHASFRCISTTRRYSICRAGDVVDVLAAGPDTAAGADAAPQVVATDAVVVLVSEKPTGTGSGGDRVVLVALPITMRTRSRERRWWLRSPSPSTEGGYGCGAATTAVVVGAATSPCSSTSMTMSASSSDVDPGWIGPGVGPVERGRSHREHQSACEDPRTAVNTHRIAMSPMTRKASTGVRPPQGHHD